MTPGFKHRLLGTSILVLVGIIFLPDLLDGEKKVVKDDFKVIPSRPEFQGVQQQQVFDQQAYDKERAAAEKSVISTETALDQEESAADKELPSERYTQVTAPSSPATSEKAPVTAPATAPVRNTAASQERPAANQVAWVVRVGSFSKTQNANALVAKLRQAGYTTFTREITNASGQKLTSVLVGPELRKEKLEQQLPKLQQLTGIERLVVVNWQPVENN
ncbi:SPOR domain-containing protein [Chromatiaceae bacterium AAb-1]|nr:SPOR domain-containing protein [Chromatiaceae bacterium AAb-1]